MDLFSMDSGFYRFMNRVGNLLILNVLFLLCCIPVITAGASATALYTVLMRLVRQEEGYVGREFFKAFKENFRQSTLLWLIVVIVGVILYCDIIFSDIMNNALGAGLKIVFLLFGFLYMATVSYVFALQSRFDNTILYTLKNAFWMAMGYLPYTISLMVVEAIPFFLIYIRPKWFWYLLPVLSTVGVAALLYICSMILNYIFKKYMGDQA
ncbi:MAG: YesL family protein [Hespellia sp.]|nr:YesL family protein [Hespellia sp.]